MMPPLAMPATPNFRGASFLLHGNTSEFTSPHDKSTQVKELPGGRWSALYTLPPMKEDEAAEWIAFLLSCDGRAGTFYAGDPARTSPRGSAGGTPKVKGASQTGKSLITDGWPISQTGILKNYDMFHFATPSGWREMHALVVDANSDGSGDSTLSIRPAIRETPADNADIVVASPSCVMSLINDAQAKWDLELAGIFGIRFQAIEVFG